MDEKKQELELPYFYGAEGEQYAFYRIPKALFTEPAFAGLSTEARLLYGLMLDRMQLSIRNGWMDEEGRIYIYYKIDQIQDDLRCKNQKAQKLLSELDEIGLIRRKRQGMGNPSRIYVMQFSAVLREVRSQKCENHTSENVKITPLEVWKSHSNKTEKNKTEINETETIHLSGSETMGFDGYDACREYFSEQLSLGCLLHDYPNERDILNEILELLVDTVCSSRETIRIGKEDKSAQVVKNQLMKLEMAHIQYVLRCLKENTTKIRNIRQYLLTALYNAPMTISSYYSTLARHNLYSNHDE
ncbi:MAG: replication initiator protein A [Lachnospiraceae bacterium]|nr:replication initiator protein A [Lachnospiraceae bacterium]